MPVRNVNRCVGGMLSSKIAEVLRRRGAARKATIKVTFTGSAGQSFGGWLAPGVEFNLRGDANDYTCKGLSGGVVAVSPPDGVTFVPEDNQLIGNTVLYGATERPRVLPRPGRRALRRAQLGRSRGHRRRGRPRLRVHDRRARRRARADGPQLRGRA